MATNEAVRPDDSLLDEELDHVIGGMIWDHSDHNMEGVTDARGGYMNLPFGLGYNYVTFDVNGNPSGWF